MMPESLRPDLCVIGGGSAGLSVAAAAAAFGVPVVLVERGAMGGECLNNGCVPSKALLASAKRAHAVRTAEAFGVKAPMADVDFAAVRARVRGVIAAIAPNDSRQRFAGLGVRVIAGAASFKDRSTVVVGGAFEIKARRFVIAAGSAPLVPPIPGLAETPHLTNETVFDLTVCPEHLVVVGAGPVGLEMAQGFRRLGARVTVLEAARPLAKDDPECAAVVLDQLTRDGVLVRAETNIVRVEGGAGAVRVVVAGAAGEETIEASHLLVAAGRKPDTQALGLEAAGIVHDERAIKVDRRLRTSNKRVYAIGDVAGELRFTHAANHQAGLVVRNALFRLRIDARAAPVPWVTYTDPELAHVGLTEAAARAKYRSIRILRWPFHENDRAQAEGTTQGHIKIVTTKRGLILGATIAGPQAGELIAPWTLAVKEGLNIRVFAEMMAPYPTFGEVGKRAAVTYFAPAARSPWVRRLIGWLRRLG